MTSCIKVCDAHADAEPPKTEFNILQESKSLLYKTIKDFKSVCSCIKSKQLIFAFARLKKLFFCVIIILLLFKLLISLLRRKNMLRKNKSTFDC